MFSRSNLLRTFLFMSILLMTGSRCIRGRPE
jgi:hypothetical protein